MGLETVDVYYIHNPETQLSAISRETFYTRIREAFGALEEACSEGKLSVYGTATWNGFRVAPENRGHLSLEELVAAAREVGMSVGSMVEKNILDYAEDAFHILLLCRCEIVLEHEI